MNAPQLLRMFGARVYSAIPDRWTDHGYLVNQFPDLPAQMERAISSASREISHERLAAIFPNAVIDIEDQNKISLRPDSDDKSNVMKMMYKYWRCNELKRKREELNGNNYSMVVRFRPDMVPMGITEKLALEIDTASPPLIYHNGSTDFVNDMLAICDSRTSDVLASLFGKAVVSYATSKPFYVHVEMKNWIDMHGFSRKAYPYGRLIQESQENQLRRGMLLLAVVEGAGAIDNVSHSEKRAIGATLCACLQSLGIGHADDALSLLSDLDFELLSPDIKASTLRVSASLLLQTGQLRAAFVAIVAAWVYSENAGYFKNSDGEMAKIVAGILLSLSGLGLGDAFWSRDCLVEILQDASIPPWLKSAAGFACEDVARSALEQTFDFFRRHPVSLVAAERST